VSDGRRATVLEGRIWVLRDAGGEIIDDIDTDMIFHNAHLAITEISQMGRHALGNLQGWEDFPRRAQPGEMVLAGRNFGAGSSRQQAVDCFVSLGVTLLLAESFGAIYKRNAINAGFPIMEAAGLSAARTAGGEPLVQSGQRVRVDLASGRLEQMERGEAWAARAMSGVQLEIYRAGGLFAYGKTLG
jgi:3-isopropylmalate/(R)-2-methylmalate dehydratase small subunit